MHDITHSAWFKEFVKDLENKVLHFVYLNLNDCMKDRSILNNMLLCKKMVQSCLRISDTFFNNMIIVGRINQCGGHISVHLETHGVIPALFHIEKVTSGGVTNNYDG